MAQALIIVLISICLSACDSEQTADHDARGSGTSNRVCKGPADASPDLGPCGCDRDCSAGGLCFSEFESGVAGGMCERLCEFGDQACAVGYKCLLFGSSLTGLCRLKCGSSKDCGPNGYCNTGDQVCEYGCAADGDCESEHCDTYRGVCTKDAEETSGGGILAECQGDDDCRSRFCSPQDGRCHTNCSVARSGCPELAQCIPFSLGNEAGTCYPTCAPDGSCRAPSLVCDYQPSGGPAVCAPPPAQCAGKGGANTDFLDCTCDADCNEGSYCMSEQRSGDPHGYCFRQCAIDADCSPGYKCYGDTPHCMLQCAANADCPTGDRCSAASGRCVGLCQYDAECLLGICDKYTGMCGQGNRSLRITGAQCNGPEDCRSFACVENVCTSLCSVDAQVCPDGAICASDAGDVGMCLTQ